ncbi:hypothetical protein [Cellulomonas sp. KRMCY2]|uniref:hypothetical protein n=1 Tax=Cellulomonas sp. KRMCY2 TaxID=1304865 RepID=UPI00045EA4FE|nr:hypothetical protein [Cellulomonas sp. KRMCY2]
MSATVQLSALPRASARRVLLTVAAIALALAVALTIAFVVSPPTAGETITPGVSNNLNPSEQGFPIERCTGSICAR